MTAGGTEEPIDSVRSLTNTSTGATGAVLARTFIEKGAEVLLLHAERASIGEVPARRETFVTFADLEAALHHHLADREWDVIVHLAAVGDYSVDAVEVDGVEISVEDRGKIGTGHQVLIRLTPNPKIIDSLKAWSLNPDVLLVGFKLTDDADPARWEQAVEKLLDRGQVDLVVHNDVRHITADRHAASFYDRKGLVTQTMSKQEMAEALWNLLNQGEIA